MLLYCGRRQCVEESLFYIEDGSCRLLWNVANYLLIATHHIAKTKLVIIAAAFRGDAVLAYVYHGTWAQLNGVLHKPFPSVCVSVCVSPLLLLGNASVNAFSRQRIQATIEELLDASFSMLSIQFKGVSVGLCIPRLAARQRLGKHVPVAKKNCWRHLLYAFCVISKKSRRLVLPRELEGSQSRQTNMIMKPGDSKSRITMLARVSSNLAVSSSS
jgi:hypothetical protein